MGMASRIAATLREKYHETKAELQGKARSKARMMMAARHIPQVSGSLKPGVPQPIPGANIRMKDNTPLTFFTDGSLRNSFGTKPEISGRQRVRLRKKIRRARKLTIAAGKAEVKA